MRRSLLALDAAAYRPHALHGEDRCWTETNCYVDVFVEVLHALGLEPRAAGAFTLSADFEGEQWSFFKHPPEDLRAQFGIEVGEMNVFRPLVVHLVEQLELGRLLTVEVDAFHLPDTGGITYREGHAKTTIVPQLVDTEAEVLGYFHGRGYYECEGEDYRGTLRLGAGQEDLPPYVELVRLERLERAPDHWLAAALDQARDHLARRPGDNPVVRLGKRVAQDLEQLAGGDLASFHAYAFATCRQCGACAEIGADFVDWLAEQGVAVPDGAAGSLRAVATGAKALEFGLARAARGRAFDPSETVAEMADAWGDAIGRLAAALGG